MGKQAAAAGDKAATTTTRVTTTTTTTTTAASGSGRRRGGVVATALLLASVAATLTWTTLVAFRVPLFTLYGRSTGKNRVPIAPLDVAGHTVLAAARVRGSAATLSNVRTALGYAGVPGEYYKHVAAEWAREPLKVNKLSPVRDVHRFVTSLPLSTAHEQAKKWAKQLEKDPVLIELSRGNQGDPFPFVTFAAGLCAAGALAALVIPREAAVLLVGGLGGMFIALQRFHNTAAPLPTAIAAGVAGVVGAFL